MALEDLEREGLVVGDPGLAHQRGVRREALDERIAIQRQHAGGVGSVREDLDAGVLDADLMARTSSVRLR